MRPYDALTEIDKETIKAYLSINGNTECGPLPQVLHYWDKNKSTLFKALGGRLRVTKMIDVPRNSKARINELEGIYHPFIFNYDTDFLYAQKNPEKLKTIIHNDFVSDLFIYWVNQNYCIQDLSILSRLFLHKNFDVGYIQSLDVNDIPYHFHDFKFTLKNGMKTMRTIQKILKIIKYPHMQKFEDWSHKINRISCYENLQSKLTISIHPIDFMTMSDNNCNWSSCMSWHNKGCYRSGTLEMMNSNVAVVVYLEAANPYTLSVSENVQYDIPNKRWRSLFFVHKKILLGGKSYPNLNKNTTIKVLDWLRELVKENLNWDYQFINQEYLDLANFENNFYVRDFWNPYYNVYWKKHHKIVVYTNAMYNDIIESKYPHYMCCRNKVDHSIKLCLSGPATCICCGKPIREREDIIDYDSIGTQLICDDCFRDRTCTVCEKTNYYMKYQNIKLKQHAYGIYNLGSYCNDVCASEIYYFPDFDRLASQTNLALRRTSDYEYYFLIIDDVKSINNIEELLDTFIEEPKTTIAAWLLNGKRIIRLPSHLAGYGYVNIQRSHYTYKAISRNRSSILFVLDSYEDADTIMKLEQTKNRIPLNEILKGSGYIEGGLTVTC